VKPKEKLLKQKHQDLLKKIEAFFDKFEILFAPTVLVPPFDIEIRYALSNFNSLSFVRYISELNNCKLESYVEWLYLTYAITVTNCPVCTIYFCAFVIYPQAISIPCGITSDGLPVGLQIIGIYLHFRILSFMLMIRKTT
jgi:amidase